jgi:hypothetical protein
MTIFFVTLKFTNPSLSLLKKRTKKEKLKFDTKIKFLKIGGTSYLIVKKHGD